VIFLGSISLLDGFARSADAITLSDTELFLSEREDFLKLIEENPGIAISLLKELSLRLRKSDTQIKSLSLFDATERVAITLLQIAENSGTIKTDVVKIDILPSQRDVANIAGTSRETVARVMNAFEKQGVIKREHGSLTIFKYNAFNNKYGL
jgi:CRP/FNR family cyclic AMP-dependent transcriptional regulator